MLNLTQTTFGKDRGNCLATSIACILEMDAGDVPDFRVTPSHESYWHQNLRWWLRGKGYSLRTCSPKNFPKDVLCIACGKSPRGKFSHAVVWRNEEMVWDPHPSREGIDGDPKYLLWIVKCRQQE